MWKFNYVLILILIFAIKCTANADDSIIKQKSEDQSTAES